MRSFLHAVGDRHSSGSQRSRLCDYLCGGSFAAAAAALFAVLLSPVVARPPEELQARLEVFARGQPGGVAVAWVDADGTSFFSAGTFSAADKRPVGENTVFEIGSITKVFTALLLAESELKGKVSREDPAARYILPPEDGLQARLGRVTLLTLTTHTSGLPRLPANLDLRRGAEADPYARYDRAMLAEGLRLHGPGCVPGRYMAYSNFGVSVLGEALATAWKTSYPEALRTRVLEPLGLQRTSVGLAGGAPPEPLAPAHADGRVVPVWTWQACAAAGGIRSTTSDLALFLGAVLGLRETPLRAAIDATLQPQRKAETGLRPMGLGWMLRGEGDATIAWHNGQTRGSHAFIGADLRGRRGIVLLSNNSRVSDRLGFDLLGSPPPAPVRTAVRDATAYTGRYELSRTFALEITERGGRLQSQATGQGRVDLREIEKDRFVLEGVPAEIVFERDSEGRISRLVLHQFGRKTPGKRVG